MFNKAWNERRWLAWSFLSSGFAALTALAGCSAGEEEVASVGEAPKAAKGTATTTDELSLLALLPAEERLRALAGPEQPVNVIYSASVAADGTHGRVTSKRLDGVAAVGLPEAGRLANPPQLGDLPLEEKLSPTLLADLEASKTDSLANPKSGTVEVLVTFVEDLRLPRFPQPIEDEPRDAASNKQVRQQASYLVDTIKELRDDGYSHKLTELSREFGARETSRFWIINGASMEVPLSAVPGIASRSDVQYVEYSRTNLPPPSSSIADGRAVIGVDPYYGYTGNWVGTVDTGVRDSHVLLSSPDVVVMARDCVNGTSNYCGTGSGINPDDDHWNHGTATVSVLSGNYNFGNAFRGVTPIYLDSWKVYDSTGYVIAAGVRAFEAAALFLDRMVVAMLQDYGGIFSATSAAADNAFNSGTMVVAAAGNYGPESGSIAAPGNAHYALAVGAVQADTLALKTFSGRGPTTDDRLKPDLLGPTDTVTASNVSSTATKTFTGTSGATPYVGGATALARNFMRGGGTIDPGQVYAYMILSGSYNSASSNNIGAGIVDMPLNGHVWWGAVTVATGQTLTLPFLGITPQRRVKAAIWWPDPGVAHNRISMRLYRPDGVYVTSSHATSVWQKAALSSDMSGNWYLRIRGDSVFATQTVYWAVFSE